jgi:hypothetical protein
MIKKSCYTLFILVVLCSNSAHAVSANVLSASALYGGIQTPAYNSSSSFDKDQVSDRNGFGYRLGFTHYLDNYRYKLSPKWRIGLKAAFTKPANNSYIGRSHNYTLSGEVASVLVIAKYYLNSNYFLMLGGGAARTVQTLRNNKSTSPIIDTNKEISPEYDAGIGIRLSKQADLSAQYTYIEGKRPVFTTRNKPNLTVNAPISMYGVMFSYTLGT